MKILSTREMSEIDRQAIEVLGVPGVVLMENAALGVVDAALIEVPGAESAVVFCGPGNNGGDGLAVARQLAVRGLQVLAIVATGGRDYSGDAGIQFRVARAMTGMGLELRTLQPVSDGSDVSDLGASFEGADLVIDALFGIGLTRPLAGQFAELVAAINAFEGPIIAVDLPSGVNGDRPEPPGPHVQADLTVTFGAPKLAHVFPPASAAAGSVVVAGLGVPYDLIERSPGNLHILVGSSLSVLLRPRPVAAHKGDFGHLLVVAGSIGKSGAAVLAAQAAVRAGAGLVTAAVPENILDAFEAASIETMSVPLPVAGADLSDTALARLEREAAGKDAVAVGPGLGSTTATSEVIRAFCLGVDLPLVLDADGLNAFAGRLETLAERARPTILTPHAGELARLLGIETSDVVGDRLSAARRAAEESGAIVILKGHLSLIADPRGGVYVNRTGNPGMATGGSGDVLTGMLGALLAQGYDALASAQLGAFVHGMAGDAAAETTGEMSLAAGDLLGYVPSSFEALVNWDDSKAEFGSTRGAA